LEAFQQTEFDEVMRLGHYPKETRASKGGDGKASNLAYRLRKARAAKKYTAAQESKLDELRRTAVHPRDAARSADLLTEAQEPPDPMEGFSDEAEHKLDQYLMLLTSGQRTISLLRRLNQYKEFIRNSSTMNTTFTQEYKERISAAFAMAAGLGTYVLGSEIDGDDLRAFSDDPIITGLLVCQLCETDSISEKSFAEHKEQAHAGESEYRMRVLYLMAEEGCRPVTAQEKRLIVQNFAHFSNFPIQ
ncbi:hypothetical protein N9L19_00485, partial [bacterium]|nr:hypothetical protein [bacterium]